VANGTTTSSIVATVLHNGTPVAGDPVTFTLTAANPTFSCGTVLAGPVTTNSAGQAATTYTSYNSNAALAPTSGFCTITATEQNTASGTTTVDQTATTSTATAIAVSANPTSVSTGGTSTVTATVTGASNTGINGDEVQFSVSGAGCGAVSPTYAPTAGSGQATTTFTAGLPGSCTVTAVESNAGQTGNTVIAVNPTVYSVAVVANPAQITGNGITTSSIMATVTNTTGAPAAGDQVTFTVTPTYSGEICGTFPGNNVVYTNSSGQAIITYTSSTNAGYCTVTATEATTGRPGSTQIDQTSI